MPPVEAWQKVFVDAEKYVVNDPHAKGILNTAAFNLGVDLKSDMDAP